MRCNAEKLLDSAFLKSGHYADGQSLCFEQSLLFQPFIRMVLGKIALSGVANDRYNDAAFGCFLSHLDRCPYIHTGGAAAKNTFFARQAARHEEGILISNVYHLID